MNPFQIASTTLILSVFAELFILCTWYLYKAFKDYRKSLEHEEKQEDK